MAKLLANGRNNNYQLADVECDTSQYGFPFIQIPKYINNVPKQVKCVATGCGHSIIVDMDGKVYGVGDNSDFQLGSYRDLIYKNLVEIQFRDNHQITWAACGYDYTIFIDSDGKLIYNGRGKIGKIIDLPNPAVFVAAGSNSPVAIDSIGDLYLFNKNIDDQPLHVNFPDPVFDVAQSNFFTIAVTTSGQCYGNGELNPLSSNNNPKEFIEIESLKGIEILYVYAFGKNACAVAADGRVFMRGPGSCGELGNGSFSDSNDFIQCSIKEKVASAALGQSFALFLTRGGTVYTCGKNSLKLQTNKDNISIPTKFRTINEKACFACCGDSHSLVLANNKIIHPGVSHFDVKLSQEMKISCNSAVSNLLDFLNFSRNHL